MHKQKYILLGYSNVGKTHFRASLLKLSYDTGEKGISLGCKQFIDEEEILKDFNFLFGDGQNKFIPSTTGLRSSEMVLKKGMDELFEIDLTDTEGQAVEPGRNQEVAEKILKEINSYDGIILLLNAPKNQVEAILEKQHLSQLLNFAGKALKQNNKIPITLVINKIDQISNSQEIKNKMDEEIAQAKSNIQQGKLINSHVTPLVKNAFIKDICEQFFKAVRNTKGAISAKVFIASSLGFGRTSNNNSAVLYSPYGSVAAFLWTVYARLEMQKSLGTTPTIPNLDLGLPLTQLIDDIRSDLQELYQTGQAYFDPDDSDVNNIWALRNTTALRSGIDR